MKDTEQLEFWKGEFGDRYISRNSGDWDKFYEKQWGISRTDLNHEFLEQISKDTRILEIGCNIGNQLNILEKDGFNNLWGLEINKKALSIARENKGITFVEGSVFDIPFKNNFFEVVFTSGVLIHIAPQDLSSAMDEIYRVSNKYIWGFEYYSEMQESITYRGHDNKLWKNNFKKLYLDKFSNLKIINEKKLKYLENENVDMMYLLEIQNHN